MIHKTKVVYDNNILITLKLCGMGFNMISNKGTSDGLFNITSDNKKVTCKECLDRIK